MNKLYIWPPDLGYNDAVRPKLASQMCMLFVNKPLLASAGLKT